MNNPLNHHHRRSIRLRDYDYTQSGLYFVTVCVNKRQPLLGNVIDGEMKLSDAGKMTEELWNKLPEKFNEVFLDEYVIMPNHFHGIIGIDNNVGVDPCVNPDPGVNPIEQGRHTGLPLQENENVNMIEGLPRYVRWFKTMTTNKYIDGVNEKSWEPFYQKLWQRNYFEHVVRNEKELSEIRKYIEINPIKWEDDEYNSFENILK